jgi:hypothetical protein
LPIWGGDGFNCGPQKFRRCAISLTFEKIDELVTAKTNQQPAAKASGLRLRQLNSLMLTGAASLSFAASAVLNGVALPRFHQ